MSNQRSPGPIPNRWLHCPRKSESIIAERFIAFKTPLSSAYNDQLPIECLFKPEMIFQWCKTLNIKLGLWIDLTNTKRFYDRKIVEDNGAQYVKLSCRGHGETPSKDQVRSFIEIVEDFISQNPFEKIGVHCTHGFNRTGFLISSYMVERMDMAVEAALSVFAAARPPGIYKQDYINELFERYDSEEEPLPAPELPAWCLEYDDSNFGKGQKRNYDDTRSSTSQAIRSSEAYEDFPEDEQTEGNGSDVSTNNSDGSIPRKRRRREMVIKNATFMEGVKGVTWFTEQPMLGVLQKKVQDMCGWSKNGFPGSQPVSMDCKNLSLLHEMPYRVSWKADGTRYMMLINKQDEIFFFDRNFSCFKVSNLTFVKAGNLGEHLEDTLVDGEMVIDKIPGGEMARFLIYDIVRISNYDIGSENFLNRYRCIRKSLTEPRTEAMSKGIIIRKHEPFSVRQKEFWPVNTAASLLGEKFARNLCHEPDGLIFQPTRQPYIAGACNTVLKWKPSELNSVDFLLKIGMESGPGILPRKIGHLYVGGYDEPFDKIANSKALSSLDNKIIECTSNNGKWEFLRERTDKTLPNSYNTAAAVCESIKRPVTKEILLNFIAKHAFVDDNNMMPPPSSHHVHRTTQPSHQQMQQQQQQQHLQ